MKAMGKHSIAQLRYSNGSTTAPKTPGLAAATASSLKTTIFTGWALGARLESNNFYYTIIFTNDG
jgi:hypothetical protein